MLLSEYSDTRNHSTVHRTTVPIIVQPASSNPLTAGKNVGTGVGCVWTVDCVLCIVYCGLWIVYCVLWIVDCGLWIVDVMVGMQDVGRFNSISPHICTAASRRIG